MSYLIRRAGECHLHVVLGGVPVHGSPFVLSVAPSAASATTSSAQGAGLVRAVVGTEAAFVITAIDAFGNKRRHGGDRFRALLTASETEPPPGAGAHKSFTPKRLLTACEVVDCEDGTYLGLYTPSAAACGQACALHVLLGEAPIRGSPFSVLVHAS